MHSSSDGRLPRSVTVHPVRVEKQFGRFDIVETIKTALFKQRLRLQSGDIVVVSSKFAAMSEGRYVRLDRIRSSPLARRVARKYSLNAQLAELVVRESEAILGGVEGFVLSLTRGVLSPNSGIDRSNVRHGYAILYPKNPVDTALGIRRGLLKTLPSSGHERMLGVLLSDSRLTPTRLGTTGIAIAVAGFRGVQDLRGKKDLFGNTLKITVRSVADQLASAAQLVMGEADDSVPVALLRRAEVEFVNEQRNDSKGANEMVIEPTKCLYVQGLRNPFNR